MRDISADVALMRRIVELTDELELYGYTSISTAELAELNRIKWEAVTNG